MFVKKTCKVLLWTAGIGVLTVIGLRYAALPYAEGRILAALRSGGFTSAELVRTGLGLYGVGYEIHPEAGQPAVVAIEVNPTFSLMEQKIVITSARVNLGADWQLPGLAASASNEPAIKFIEKPLLLPVMNASVSRLEVATPLGQLLAGGDYAGRSFTGKWEFMGYDGTLTFAGDDKGAYAVAVDTISGLYPFALALKGGQEKPVITANASVPHYAVGPVALSDITVTLNEASKEGYVLPYKFAATLLGKPLVVSGTADVLKQTARGLATADVKMEGLEAVGIKSNFELTSLWPPVVKNGATLQATALQIGGLPLIGPRASFGFRNNRVNLQSASAGLFGGKVSLAPVQIAIPLRRVTGTAHFEGLELAQVLQLAAVDGLGGDGTLSGSIPVTYDNAKITLGQAQLKATGSGQIYYRPAVPPSFLAAGGSGAMLGQVFSDFQYSGLTIGLGGTLGDNLTLTARLEGRNPSFYNGHSVAFNLNLSGALESLLTQGLQSFQFSPEAIKQMTEEGTRP